jgi:hypothetical protein
MAKLRCYNGSVFYNRQQPTAYVIARSWVEAHRLLGAAGFIFSLSGLKNWFHGPHATPPKFLAACPESAVESGVWVEKEMDKPNPEFVRLIDKDGAEVKEQRGQPLPRDG